jgi:K+-transporting ATPase ATPase C chain
MFEIIKGTITKAIRLLLLLTVVLGLIYPLLVTAIAQIFFPWQANGSLIASQDKIVGSLLIGQYFSDPKYFWGRVSATQPYPYNAENSSGSNLAATNPLLVASVKKQISHLKTIEQNALVPVDLVTSSASGLDPEISPMAAYYQVPRIAKARKISEKILLDMINEHKKGPFLTVLGETRLRVLELNLLLDNLQVSKVEK